MRKFLLISVLSFCVSALSFAQSNAFESLSGLEGVEYIRLDKAMLTAALQASSPESDVSQELKDVDDITVVMVDKDEPKAARKASRLWRKAARRFTSEAQAVESGGDEGSATRLYSRNLPDEKHEYLVCYDDDDELILVLVTGLLAADDAQKLVHVKQEVIEK